MLAIGLERAGADPVAVGCSFAKRRMSTTQRSIGASSATDPLASTQPAPPAEAMPKALKPAPTYRFLTSGAAPRMKLPSGVKLSGPLIICRMPAFSSAGTRASAVAHVLLEMIPVVLEELELERFRHIAGVPGDGVRLIAAEHEAPDLLLEVGAPVGIAHRRQPGGEAADLFGD